jgi:hypothetical protein
MPGSSLLTSCVAGAGAGAGMVGPPVVAAAAIAPEWGGVPAHRNRIQLLTIESPHVTVSGLAKLGRPFEYRVEDWYEVARRTGDDLEHLQRRGLLLPCLAQFAGESCDLCIFAQSGKTPIAGGLWCGAALRLDCLLRLRWATARGPTPSHLALPERTASA